MWLNIIFKKHPWLVFLAILIAVHLFIFREFWFGGLYPIPFNNLVLLHFPYTSGDWENPGGLFYQGGLYANDVYRQMIPWKQLALESFKNGQIPWWNPYNFSGEPLFANIQTTLLYPLTLLYFIFDFYTAWSLYVMASPFIAALGMFLFLKQLKLPFFASLIGAFAFAFATREIAWFSWGVVTQSGVWLPWLLWSFEGWLERKPYRLPIFFFALVSTLLGGYPQESVYALIVLSLYGGYLLWLHKDELKLKQFLPVIVGFLIITPWVLSQFIPTAQFFLYSSIKQVDSATLFNRTMLHPWQLTSLMAPDFFGNRVKDNYWADTFTVGDYLDSTLYFGGFAFIAFIFELAIVAQSVRNKKNQISGVEWFMLFLGGTALLTCLPTPLHYLLSLTEIPIITSGAAVGVSYISIFCFIVLASFGIKHWTASKQYRLQLALPLIFVLLGCSLLFVPAEYLRVALRNSVIPTGVALMSWFLFMIYKYMPQPKVYLLVSSLIFAIAIVDYNRQMETMVTYASEDLAFPQHPAIKKLKHVSGLYRSNSFWDADITPNLHTQFGLYSINGYNPLNLGFYQELVAGSGYDGYPETIRRSDAVLDVDNESGRNRLMSLTSTKYILAKTTNPDEDWEREPQKFDPAHFQLIWQDGWYKIYEFLPVLERASLFNRYQVLTMPQERLDTLYDPEFDWQTTLILEENINQTLNPEATGSAEIVSYQPNRIVIQTQVDNGPMLLLLNDTYYPIWKARVNEESVPIHRANHAFRAIIVPDGPATVVFEAGLR